MCAQENDPHATSVHPPLALEDRRLLLALARSTIASAFEGEHPPVLEDPPPALRVPRGVFVSLHRGGQLRGCIGTLEAKEPLWQVTERMALASAFDDPRFPPLAPEELDLVDIEVDVLGPPRPASPRDIVPGLHGVVLTLGGSRGVFLPQVALEQGWDREELLRQLCRKASLPDGAWKERDARLYVFEAERFSERDLGRHRFA
ncbi:MAG: hypothetical protein KatS3mg076_0645 [Candidatus Binatia bacterium]|nr:MAG: hypothetical protein KatS3mg076_0645 [Candidatus Binatia bacterium]